MAKPFNNYSELYFDETNTLFSGIAYVPDFSLYSQYFKEGVVSAEQEYRPDKIAWDLWDDQNAGWILFEINGFIYLNEFSVGTKYYYLDYSILQQIGVV